MLPACVLGAAGLPAALGYSGACLDFVASNGAHALLHTGADVVLNLPAWLAAPGCRAGALALVRHLRVLAVSRRNKNTNSGPAVAEGREPAGRAVVVVVGGGGAVAGVAGWVQEVVSAVGAEMCEGGEGGREVRVGVGRGAWGEADVVVWSSDDLCAEGLRVCACMCVCVYGWMDGWIGRYIER